MPSPRVLVVEDDLRLRTALCRGLQDGGFEVDTVGDGAAALRQLNDAAPYRVVLLDIGLPDADGRDVCQAIRSRGIDTPVLFLTARGQIDDQLSAFAAGGDDFLPKPFHVDVLLARTAALARRPPITTVAPSGRGIHLEPATHSVVSGARSAPLTPTEYRILGCLLASSGAVLRRRDLVRAAWPVGAMVSDNTLDQYVVRLRRKLASLSTGTRVVTVHGVGYRVETAGAA